MRTCHKQSPRRIFVRRRKKEKHMGIKRSLSRKILLRWSAAPQSFAKPLCLRRGKRTTHIKSSKAAGSTTPVFCVCVGSFVNECGYSGLELRVGDGASD